LRRSRFVLALLFTLAASIGPVSAFGQDVSPQAQAAADSRPSAKESDSDQEPKRIFGIIPNYRTFPTLDDYQPIPAKEKWSVATQDAFDRGTFVLGALFAAQGQLAESNPSFGHGFSGYGKYFAASTADFIIGDFMTEAVFPAALHQDPRYFRRGTGGKWSRLGYAMGQIFWTHTDSGGMQVNVSEIAGNATAVAISNAYYPDGRTVSSNASKLAIQIGVDMAANVLKEFAPDLTEFFHIR